MNTVLAFDIGGTKTAWGIISDDGTLGAHDSFPTPKVADAFIDSLVAVAKKNPDVGAIGIGIAGIVSPDHEDILLFTNIPSLSHSHIAEKLEEATDLPVKLENDGRCALIGEAWLGAAKDLSSAVLVTVGTGVGGAVMQKGKILPHPTDITKELGSIVADPTDLWPTKRGRGCVEALIGGKNIEERFDVDLHEMALAVRKGDEEAVEFWQTVSHHFMECMRAIHDTYSCRIIIIGGVGSRDLEYYLQGTPPCDVIPATLGVQAGLFGAAQIGFDALNQKQKEESDDWD